MPSQQLLNYLPVSYICLIKHGYGLDYALMTKVNFDEVVSLWEWKL